MDTKNKPEEKQDSAGALKKKTRIYSANAALISVAIHLLVIILAGSWVAVRYVQKKKAELTVYRAPAPKMERRQLSAPLKKADRIKQSSQRPKIVSSRAASSDTEFALPAVASGAQVSTQKFSTPFSESGRDFSMLTKGLTFEIPHFKFLGVRGTGEKLAFIIEATPEMLADRTGGEAACAHIKEELNTLLSEMTSSVLFNVILYNGDQVASFQPKMAPVTDENVSLFREWFTPALSHLSPKGLTQNTYEPAIQYDSAMGNEVKNWLRATQCALEQRPDTIIVVGRDWGRHGISPQKGQVLMEFSLWEFLGGSGKSSVGGVEALLDDREMRDTYVVEAVAAIEEEEKLLRKEDPVPFLHNLVDYMQYTADQVMDHLDVVYKKNYASVQQAPPQIHFVRLVAADDMRVADSSTTKIRELVRAYNGEFKFLNGTQIRGNKMAKNAPDTDDGAALGEPVESVVKFFGQVVKSARVAFVVDASANMFTDRTGGDKSFQWLKEKVAAAVKSLEPETKFNIFVCNEERAVAFTSQLESGADPAKLDRWFAAAQQGLNSSDLLTENGQSEATYTTAMGSDIHGVPLALQMALEQRPDVVLVAGAGIGPMPVARVKAQRLLDFAVVHSLGSFGDGPESVNDLIDNSSAGMLAPLVDDQEQWQTMMLQALDLMEADRQQIEDAGGTLGFVRDLFDFIQYTPEHLLDHLRTVCRSVYPIRNDRVSFPKIYFAKLTDRSAKTERKQLDEFRGFEKEYGGNARLINGASEERKTREFGRSGPSLADLPKRKTLGLPKFKYLDVRASGEKLVFLLDASRMMTSERLGGAIVGTYIKDQLLKTLTALPESVQFNVILYDGRTVATFRPSLAFVSAESLGELKEWLLPVLNPLYPFTPEKNSYIPSIGYKTAINREVSSVARAMQAALEQLPDTLFIVGHDWGRHDVSSDKGQGLINFSLWQLLGGRGSSSIAETPILLKDRDVRDDGLINSVDLITRLGPDRDPFVHKLSNYMQYSGDQVIDHLTRVCVQNYLPANLGPPQVSWIRLVSEKNVGRSDVSTQNIRELTRDFGGEFEFLDGEKIRDEYASKIEDEEESDEVPGASQFTFFGTQVDASAVAFVLDASDAMFADETGGDAPIEFFKGQIAQMVSELTPETLCNVLVCNESRVVKFTPEMRAGVSPTELDAWFADVQHGLDMPNHPVEKGDEVSVTVYQTAIGAGIQGVPLAIQVAMEQHADAILVAEAGMGHFPVEREKARRLLDFSILKKLGARGTESDTSNDVSSSNDDDDEDDDDDLDQRAGGAMVAPLVNDQAQVGQLIKQAFTLMEEENEAREEEGLPLGFVRNIFDYIEYTSGHILKHLTTVSREVYPVVDEEFKPPQIHFAHLIDGEVPVDRKTLREYKGYQKPFMSEVHAILGAPSVEKMRAQNRSLDLYE